MREALIEKGGRICRAGPSSQSASIVGHAPIELIAYPRDQLVRRRSVFSRDEEPCLAQFRSWHLH